MIRFKSINTFFSNTIGLLLVLLSFSIPINYRYTIYLLELTVFFWILSRSWHLNFSMIRLNKPAVFLVVLWILYLVSLIYSDNLDRGFSDVIQKISILLFPLIFISSWDNIRKYKDWILKAFLVGLAFVSLFLIGRAFYYSFNFSDFTFNSIPIETPWENFFLYFRFTEPYHPTYLSLYLSFGLALIAKFFIESKRSFIRINLILTYSLFLLLIYLSSSKAGLIVGAFVFILSMFWVIGRKSRIYAGIGSALIFILILFSMINNSRIMYFVNYIQGNTNTEYSFNDVEFENKLRSEATVRIDIWKSIPSIVGKDWLFGVGIGDSKQVLVDGYYKNGIKYAANAQLNAHNQYLEVFVGLGIIGLFALLILLGSGIRQALSGKDMLLFIFIAIIAINFLFESMFERVFGVMFFSFFFCLLTIKDVNSNS